MKQTSEAIAVSDSMSTIKEHWQWIEQNVVPELLQMEADEQILDYLLLKFECLAIERGRDQEDEVNKKGALFDQHFGLKDETLLERA